MAYKEIKVKQQPTERQFWDFCAERYNIHVLRFYKKQPPPWTDDPILQTYKFCNIFRHHDRGTQWAIDNIINLHVPSQVFFRTVAYRCCNRIETFERYGFPAMDGRSIRGFIRGLSRCEDPVFNSAYRASAFGSTPRLEIYTKILMGAKSLAMQHNSFMMKLRTTRSMLHAWEMIQILPGVGPFIANEILLDLTYDGKSFFINGIKENFVNVGPGAQVGLELMYGKLSNREAQSQLTSMKSKQRKYWPRELPALKIHDVQFAMCEFRKYIALSNGQGKKRKFILKS